MWIDRSVISIGGTGLLLICSVMLAGAVLGVIYIFRHARRGRNRNDKNKK